MNRMKKKRTWRMRNSTTVIAVALSVLFSATSYAGEWVEAESNVWQYVEGTTLSTGWKEIEGQWYYFNSEGIMHTGWIKDSELNQWYFLDTGSGAWESRPVMNETTAVHLLENALIRSNLYQNEEFPLLFKVDEVTKSKIKVSVGVEKMPEVFSSINIYEIDKKTGLAAAVVGDDLSLY